MPDPHIIDKINAQLADFQETHPDERVIILITGIIDHTHPNKDYKVSITADTDHPSQAITMLEGGIESVKRATNN